MTQASVKSVTKDREVVHEHLDHLLNHIIEYTQHASDRYVSVPIYML